MTANLSSIDISFYLEVLSQNAHSTLAPYWRNNIYQSLKKNKGFTSLIYLDMISVLHIIPVWQEVWPENNLPLTFANLIEGVLRGTTSIETVHKYWASQYDYVEAEASDPESFEEGRAACVLLAAYTALGVSRGEIEWYPYYKIDQETTDEDLGFGSSDTARWAAGASAGFYWEEGFEPQKSKNFWEWWLIEAIPKAYTSVA